MQFYIILNPFALSELGSTCCGMPEPLAPLARDLPSRRMAMHFAHPHIMVLSIQPLATVMTTAHRDRDAAPQPLQ